MMVADLTSINFFLIIHSSFPVVIFVKVSLNLIEVCDLLSNMVGSVRKIILVNCGLWLNRL